MASRLLLQSGLQEVESILKTLWEAVVTRMIFNSLLIIRRESKQSKLVKRQPKKLLVVLQNFIHHIWEYKHNLHLYMALNKFLSKVRKVQAASELFLFV